MRYIKDSPEGASYSQDQEDILAESHYFHNLHNGTFLEMGALDGSCLKFLCRRPSHDLYPLLRDSSISPYTLYCEQVLWCLYRMTSFGILSWVYQPAS